MGLREFAQAAKKLNVCSTNDTIGSQEERIDISVVVPAFNEAGNVGPLMAELSDILPEMHQRWEVIWIDDASTDGTVNELESLLESFPEVRVLRLRQHAGQSAALWAGLRAARGEIIVTLDGDGQNDPRDIPRLIVELGEADFVIGQRRIRQDGIAKRVFGLLANAARNALTGSQLPDSGCALRAFRRGVLAAFIPFDGMHRFLPTMAEIGGYRVRSIEVNHRPRQRGKSKYGIVDRLIGPLLDCLMLWRLKRRGLGAIECEEMIATEWQAQGEQRPMSPWQARELTQRG